MGFAVRPATATDAAAIAAVHVDAWRVAYAHIFDAAFLAGLSVEARTERWENIIAELPGGERLDVAEAGGELVGFCHAGPSRDEDGAGCGEVYAVYVSPSHWGRGAGRVLLEAAEQRLAGGGFRAATLWVLDKNDQARAFYERRGWDTNGATKRYQGGATAVRYRRALADHAFRTRS